jgi:hypothetical protein
MSSYAEASAAVSGEDDSRHGMCAAPGCCLPGVLTTSTTGSKNWWCTVHFQLPHAEHDAATALIANRKELWHIARQLTNPERTGTDLATLRARVKVLRPDLIQTAHEKRWDLASHMIAVLFRECRTPQAHMGTPKQGAADTSWLDASRPEELDA